MISSGTLARGWSSTRKRTAAATSAGWRIDLPALLADGDGAGVEDRGVHLAGVDHRRADARSPLPRGRCRARARPGRTSRPSNPPRRARWPACPRPSRSGRPGRSPRPHRRQDEMDEVERPGQVGGDHPVPVGRFERRRGSGCGRSSRRCRPARRSRPRAARTDSTIALTWSRSATSHGAIDGRAAASGRVRPGSAPAWPGRGRPAPSRTPISSRAVGDAPADPAAGPGDQRRSRRRQDTLPSSRRETTRPRPPRSGRAGSVSGVGV